MLKQMLVRAGIEPGRDLQIVELPGARGRNVSFGVFAAHALEARQIDGFWANAMGAELAVSRGAGKVLIDVRRPVEAIPIADQVVRGLIPWECFCYLARG
jgi:NitT/TauT family transport system substrate-binding protein